MRGCGSHKVPQNPAAYALPVDDEYSQSRNSNSNNWKAQIRASEVHDNHLMEICIFKGTEQELQVILQVQEYMGADIAE